jgi:hypothetical protein
MSLPSPSSGLQTDDHMLFRAIESDAPLFELWRVAPERFHELRARGTFAWWAARSS